MIVFGDGGLLDYDYFRPGWTDVLRATSAEAIAWGVGHNRHGAGRGRYPDFLQSFALVGVRDSGARRAGRVRVGAVRQLHARRVRLCRRGDD